MTTEATCLHLVQDEPKVSTRTQAFYKYRNAHAKALFRMMCLTETGALMQLNRNGDMGTPAVVSLIQQLSSIGTLTKNDFPSYTQQDIQIAGVAALTFLESLVSADVNAMANRSVAELVLSGEL